MKQREIERETICISTRYCTEEKARESVVEEKGVCSRRSSEERLYMKCGLTESTQYLSFISRQVYNSEHVGEVK